MMNTKATNRTLALFAILAVLVTIGAVWAVIPVRDSMNLLGNSATNASTLGSVNISLSSPPVTCSVTNTFMTQFGGLNSTCSAIAEQSFTWLNASGNVTSPYIVMQYAGSPGLPSSGIVMYDRSIGGYEAPGWVNRDDEFVVGPHWAARTICILTPSSSTTIRDVGVGCNPTTVGTVSHVSSLSRVFPYFANIVSAGANNSQAATQASGQRYFPGVSSSSGIGGVFFHARAMFNDSVSLANRTYTVTLCSSDATVCIDAISGSENIAAFRAEYGASNWSFFVDNSTTTAVNVTLPMAFSNETAYDFYIYVPRGQGGTVKYAMRDIEANTWASGVVTSVRLPPVSALRPIVGCSQKNAVACNLRFTRFYIETS